jgi:carbamoylphosphate synthase large subunit
MEEISVGPIPSCFAISGVFACQIENSESLQVCLVDSQPAATCDASPGKEERNGE